MKKVNILLMALVIALAFGANAFAKNGLSVGLGLGMKADMNQLGGTITDDGLDGGEQHQIWDKAVIDEKTLLSLEKALLANGTALPAPLVNDVEANGAMSGLDFAINVRYDFLDKFFARTGFNYTMKIIGGETSWKYSTTAAISIANAASGNAGPTNGIFQAVNTAVDGYKASQTWESSAWQIPFVLGINVPTMEGKVNFYAGVGLAVSYGKWSVEIESLDILYGVTSAGLTAESKEKVEFSYLGVAPMYVLGVDAELAMGVSLFIEWETILGMGYSDVKSVKTDVGQAALGTDKVTYPVVTGGSIFRIGASYKIPLEI